MPKRLRVLVIELAFPGDAILSTCLAEELKRLDPQIHVSYLVRKEVAALIACSPSVDEVIGFDKRNAESGLRALKAKAAELNAVGFDAVYVLHESTRTRALVDLLAIPTKRLLSEAAHLQASQYRTERLLSILASDYPAASVATLPKLQPPPTDPEFAERIAGDYLVLAPGSVWKTKRWPASRFADVAVELLADGKQIVIIGGKDDQALGAIIASADSSGRIVDLTGRTSLVQAASLIASAQLVIANDSAPVHIATSVDTHAIAIFGPTIPAFGFAPVATHGEVVEIKGLWCRPCTSHGPDECPTHTHECMNLISAESVLAHARRWLKLQC